MTEPTKKHRPRTALDAINELITGSSAVALAFRQQQEDIKQFFNTYQKLTRAFKPLTEFIKLMEEPHRRWMDIMKPVELLATVKMPTFALPKSLIVLSKMQDIIGKTSFTESDLSKLLSLSEQSRERYIRDVENLVNVLQKKLVEKEKTIAEQKELIAYLEGYIKMLKDMKKLDYIQ